MSTLRAILVSPLPPPASGIASWSMGVLKASKGHHDLDIILVDTAVRWRSTNDVSLWKRLLGGTFQAIRDTLRVYNAIKKTQPNLIHLCTSGSLGVPKDILILALAKIKGVRSVLHYHRGDLPDIVRKKGLSWYLLRWAIQLADAVLLLDESSEESARVSLPGNHVRRIPNPIDIEMIRESASQNEREQKVDSKTRIVYAGWVVPSKGVSELVEACAMINGFDLELNIVGNVLEDYRLVLEKIAIRRGSGKWLRFHGMVGRTEAINLISSADIFVLPSYTEGFPNVVLEAMLLGRPIIATRVGAIPEMLGENTENPCGLLINPNDAEGLRDALLYLINNQEKASIFGERAKMKAIECYSLEKVMGQYLGLWRSLFFVEPV